MPVNEIVHVVNSGPNWTAIAGIAGTALRGLVGAGATHFFGEKRDAANDTREAARRRQADVRRFEHDRAIRSADDLIQLLDEVDSQLENLADRTAAMRQVYLAVGRAELVELVGPLLREADDQYQKTRATIARLRMRPRANDDLLKWAKETDEQFLEAIKVVRSNFTATFSEAELREWERRNPLAGSKVAAFIDAGYAGQTAFEAKAREAIDKLLGSVPDLPDGAVAEAATGGLGLPEARLKVPIDVWGRPRPSNQV